MVGETNHQEDMVSPPAWIRKRGASRWAKVAREEDAGGGLETISE